MMRPASASTKAAQTASSMNRNTAIRAETAKAQAKRNYKPPPTASKKVAIQNAKAAAKVAGIEAE